MAKKTTASAVGKAIKAVTATPISEGLQEQVFRLFREMLPQVSPGLLATYIEQLSQEDALAILANPKAAQQTITQVLAGASPAAAAAPAAAAPIAAPPAAAVEAAGAEGPFGAGGPAPPQVSLRKLPVAPEGGLARLSQNELVTYIDELEDLIEGNQLSAEDLKVARKQLDKAEGALDEFFERASKPKATQAQEGQATKGAKAAAAGEAGLNKREAAALRKRGEENLRVVLSVTPEGKVVLARGEQPGTEADMLREEIKKRKAARGILAPKPVAEAVPDQAAQATKGGPLAVRPKKSVIEQITAPARAEAAAGQLMKAKLPKDAAALDVVIQKLMAGKQIKKSQADAIRAVAAQAGDLSGQSAEELLANLKKGRVAGTAATGVTGAVGRFLKGMLGITPGDEGGLKGLFKGSKKFQMEQALSKAGVEGFTGAKAGLGRAARELGRGGNVLPMLLLAMGAKGVLESRRQAASLPPVKTAEEIKREFETNERVAGRRLKLQQDPNLLNDVVRVLAGGTAERLETNNEIAIGRIQKSKNQDEVQAMLNQLLLGLERTDRVTVPTGLLGG